MWRSRSMSLTIILMFVICLELFIIGCHLLTRRGEKFNFSRNILLVWLLWATINYGLIETLSIFKLLLPLAIYIGWGIVASLLLGVILVFYRERFPRAIPKINLGVFTRLRLNLQWENILFYFILVVGLSILAIVAFVYPPNNFDSMTYHLPRVMHWAQDLTVNPYPTSIIRQVQLQPFAEYLLLNLYLLSGTDRLFNFLQLGAFVVCLFGTYEITNTLGGSNRTARIAVILGITLPTALSQSVTTQNDLVSAAFGVCFLCLGYQLIKNNNWFWAVGTGLSLGLAMLTKASIVVFLFPFCLYIGWHLIRKYKRRALGWGALVGILAIGIYAPYSLRMYATFGSLFGPTTEYSNGTMGLNVLLSNGIRNFALNYQPAPEGFDIQKYIQNGLAWIHKVTGLSPRDPRTTFMSTGDPFNLVNVVNEDLASNPIHASLIFITAIIAIFKLWKRRDQISIYSFLLVVGFILFSGLFRWQLWGNRLLLPLFIFWCPAIAYLSLRHLPIWVTAMGLAFMLWLGFAIIDHSSFRPLNSITSLNPSQTRLMFASSPWLMNDYQGIMSEIASRKCLSIGLVIGPDTWEYPFWRLMKKNGIDGKIEHVGVMNETKKFYTSQLEPCAVIVEKEWGRAIEGPWSKKAFQYFDLYLEQ
jgi:hypothetical protein